MQNCKFCNSFKITSCLSQRTSLIQLPFYYSFYLIQIAAESIQVCSFNFSVAVHVIKVNSNLTNHSGQNTYQSIYTAITVESFQLQNWRKYLKNQFWGGSVSGGPGSGIFVWRIFQIEEYDQRSNKQAKYNKIFFTM
ncbi:Hypothetical_protein [Hexamita inflata]|uniref:Hypothetical_protein n=1 Tax=Hexamita inflata TaxID=28002 RepID=A0AA86TJJ4_9EUKA|nr:Hypothetical protein HINF_LOCUS7020 [Hexamita inflata]